MNESGKAVFLSYAREDAAAALRIAEALRSQGVEVWFDQNELRGGDAWDAKIKQQIRECALFMPVVSAHTQQRGEGYFRREWKLAVERTNDMAAGIAFVVPVAIDDTKEADAVVPEEFMRVQWTRLRGALPTPEFVEQVARMLAQPRTPAPAARKAGQVSDLPQSPVAPRRQRNVAWLAIAAVAVVGAGGIGAWWLTRTAPVSPAHGQNARATPSPAAQAPLDFATAKSIAVLPFVNLGADKADEYLGDGITEELLNALCQIKGLRVPGRSSCFAFKGKTGDDIFRQVGEKLRVSTVLEGSVRKAGDKIRITAQLINVADGFHLWSKTYDGDMKDILAVQSEVSQRVVQALQLHLGGEESRSLAKKTTNHPEAHRLYLLGRFHFAKNTAAGGTEAMRCFTQAIELDPGYALAYCGLADAYGWIQLDEMPGRIAWAREREMAEKALALDPALPEAHFSLGIALAATFEWPAGEKAIRRALELNPNLALAYGELAWIHTCFGRFDEASASSSRALELDPLSPLLNVEFAAWLRYARRYDEAIAQARKALELDPNNAMAYRVSGLCRLWQRDHAGAIANLEKAVSLEPLPRPRALLAYAYAVSGQRAKAGDILRELETLSTQRYVSPGTHVLIHIGLGDKGKALDWLEKAYEEQDVVCFLKMDPIYDPIRHEPRFQALLKKVGLDK